VNNQSKDKIAELPFHSKIALRDESGDNSQEEIEF
jgi:hypothetical protein